MATNILGISAFYHDSAAALVRDGEIIAAAQEERFTRKKHDPEFPLKAIEYCLKEGNITAEQLDYVGFYDKPLTKFDRLLETYLAYAPAGLRSFMKAIPLWLGKKLHLPREIDRGLGNRYHNPILFTDHHESHAASTFFPSPFEEAAILTIDGVGEWTTTAYGIGRGNEVKMLRRINFPHSLGLLYSAFTYYTGFKVNSGEYKLMGLAPYGEPRYYQAIMEKLIDLKSDGSFRLDQSYFNYCQGLTMTNAKFHRLFGGPPRKPESLVTQHDMDLAASIQKVTDEIMLRLAQHIHRETGMKNLCLAGGVALNCVANGAILREGPFANLFIQPAAGDAGGALGTALFIWYQYLGHPRQADGQHDFQKGSYLGPAFSNEEIRQFLDRQGARYHALDEEQLLDRVSELMAAEKVIGWFHGRMEFGPRALGARSILGDARSERMQREMNLKIKFRESFRPFAPSVMIDHVAEYFDLDRESPYMLLVASVRQDKRVAVDPAKASLFGMDKLNVKRSTIPAITHIDYSARLQTVDPQRSPRYYRLLDRFYRRTGCPVIVNTSFNIRGEPIVCRPEEAYRCFMLTHIDALVLEDQLLLKEEQPTMGGAEAYKKQFQLD